MSSRRSTAPATHASTCQQFSVIISRKSSRKGWGSYPKSVYGRVPLSQTARRFAGRRDRGQFAVLEFAIRSAGARQCRGRAQDVARDNARSEGTSIAYAHLSPSIARFAGNRRGRSNRRVHRPASINAFRCVGMEQARRVDGERNRTAMISMASQPPRTNGRINRSTRPMSCADRCRKSATAARKYWPRSTSR